MVRTLFGAGDADPGALQALLDVGELLRLRSLEGTLEVRCGRRWSDLGADDQPGDILWVQRRELLEV